MGGLTANDLELGGPVHCSCGSLLVEELGELDIVVDDHHHPFRRRTDYLLCADCGNHYPVRVLRHVCLTDREGAGER